MKLSPAFAVIEMNYFDSMVDHIAKFAMMPHWLDEMRRFTKTLEKQEIYQGIGLAVAEKIKSLKEQQK
jgi:hypothetical protein